MDKDRYKELWLIGLQQIKHWSLVYRPRDVKLTWPEAKADLMVFINQMDKDWEVWEMEKRK